MSETQETITEWGINTFGRGTALTTLLRCAVEMNEAAIAIAYDNDLELIEDEMADIDIVLDQVFELLGIGANRRQVIKDRKMQVNRARTWGRTATGRAQHIEEA